MFLLAFGASAAEFRASAVKVDITPTSSKYLVGYQERQSTGVHDKIWHRIVALDDGANQMYFVSTDLCLFSPGLYDEVAQQLKREMGIDRTQFWWSVTHTHSGPEIGPPAMYKTLLGRSDHEWDRAYTEQVTKLLVDGIRDAKAKLMPARLATGIGFARASINRRGRDEAGRISLGLNPDGPADRQLGLIRVEKTDGSPIALIANYSMHGTVLSGANLEISGDAPGVAVAYAEEKLGAMVMFVNGAAGNLAPIYSVYPNPRAGHLNEFRVLLGERILQTNRELGPATPNVKLWAGEKLIETQRKDGLDWPAEMKAYTRDSNGTSLVRLPVRFLRMNDTVIWAAPVEMFCEISMRVRNESPFPRTMYFGYTNGWFGYLPTAAAYTEGGYEPKTSPFTAKAERDIGDGVVSFLESIPR